MNASRRSSPLPDVGLGSAFGGWFGVILALLWNFDLPLGLVIGAAVGVLIGATIDAINSRRDRRDERRTPPEQSSKQ